MNIAAKAGLAGLAVAASVLAATPVRAQDVPDFNRDPARARIVTADLDRFRSAWDEAARRPAERRAIFEQVYLDAASPGLAAFLELRIRSVDALLAAIDRYPHYYAGLRTQLADVPGHAEPVRAAFQRLHELLPDAVFPDVYLMVGAMNSGGTIHQAGLLVGVDMYGLTPDTRLDELGAWHRAVLRPMHDLPAIIVHELMHFQQAVLGRAAPATLLGQSIHEGAADFLAERVLGRHTNETLHAWARPREAALWAEFREVMHGSDYGAWLYQGEGAADRPADLGYFIGYRIAQAYYEGADDERAAFRAIVTATDYEALLAASGYARRFAPGR